MPSFSKTLKRLQAKVEWFKSTNEPFNEQELRAKIKQLEELVEIRAQEYVEHTTDLRRQRDSLQASIEMFENWIGHIADAVDCDVPSIINQGKEFGWNVNFFDFGKAKFPNVRYFNGAICRGGFLIARRAYEIAGQPIGMNDLVVFKLDETNKPAWMMPIKIPSPYKEHQFEDPRTFWYKDQRYVSCCNFQLQPNKKWTGAHQTIVKLTPDWNAEQRIEPIYGRNGGSIYANTGNEKNWLWFEHDGVPYFVYKTAPHQVVRCNQWFEPQETYETKEFNPFWQHGEPRGGSSPIRLGDEYWTFFHSSTPWIGKYRRYHMGALAFQAKPPFAITRMSSLPILSGSKNDRWIEGLPLVVFPSGAVFDGKTWTVSMGVNDCESAYIQIPHDELVQTDRKTPAYVEPQEILGDNSNSERISDLEGLGSSSSQNSSGPVLADHAIDSRGQLTNSR